MKKRIIPVLILIFIVQGWTQQHISKKIQELENDFKSFKYEQVLEKGKFLLSDPYVTKDDSLKIFQYMLNSAYALADTTEARKIIKQIIKCDPQFSLSPIETSPKIIEFFEHVKKQIQENKPLIPSAQQGILQFPYKPVPYATNFLSILLPGSGHLHQKFTKRGLWFTGISAGLITGMVYATIQTEKKRDAYMAAKPKSDFNRLYDDYNRIYRIRNVLWASFIIWDMYVLYDLQKQWQFRVNPTVDRGSISVNITKRW